MSRTSQERERDLLIAMWEAQQRHFPPQGETPHVPASVLVARLDLTDDLQLNIRQAQAAQAEPLPTEADH